MERMSIFVARKRAPTANQLDRTRKRVPATTFAWEVGDGDPVYDIEVLPAHNDNGTAVSAPPRQPTSANGLFARYPTPHRSSPQPEAPADEGFAALTEALDEALDRWWSDDELPSLALLREGLLALEAGQTLDEGQRTLLLRTALARNKGVLTALRHQTDPDRTAFLLKETLLEAESPLPPAILWRLQQEDAQSKAWAPILIHELQDEVRAVQGLHQELAAAALAVLESKRPPAPPGAKRLPRVDQLLNLTVDRADQPLGQRYWSPGRVVVWTLLTLLILGGLLLYRNRALQPTTVTIPAGDYMIGATEMQRPVALVGAVAFDVIEVTNSDYQQCVAAGSCVAPSAAASLTRRDYFTNPAFAEYPVVYVDWSRANAYCAWLGKRLPTADEWEVAASVAPVTQRHFRYPWGEEFDARLANTQATGLGDTNQAGAYRPTGDSSFGLADMAGNVAEWTSTQALNRPAAYIVKGGSFQDEPAAVQASAQQSVEAQTTAPWLGFRCATDLPE